MVLRSLEYHKVDVGKGTCERKIISLNDVRGEVDFGAGGRPGNAFPDDPFMVLQTLKRCFGAILKT